MQWISCELLSHFSFSLRTLRRNSHSICSHLGTDLCSVCFIRWRERSPCKVYSSAIREPFVLWNASHRSGLKNVFMSRIHAEKTLKKMLEQIRWFVFVCLLCQSKFVSTDRVMMLTSGNYILHPQPLILHFGVFWHITLYNTELWGRRHPERQRQKLSQNILTVAPISTSTQVPCYHREYKRCDVTHWRVKSCYEALSCVFSPSPSWLLETGHGKGVVDLCHARERRCVC